VSERRHQNTHTTFGGLPEYMWFSWIGISGRKGAVVEVGINSVGWNAYRRKTIANTD